MSTMQELFEFFEMVSLNDATLRGSEKMAILKAKLALAVFARAMETFTKPGSPRRRATAEAELRTAA